MLNRLLVFIVVSAAFVISAAVSPANEPPRDRRAFTQALNKIKNGMPEAEVIAIVGRPDDIGNKKEANLGHTLEIWRYGTSGHKKPATLGQIWIDVDHRVQLIAGQGTPPPEGLFTESELRRILAALHDLPGLNGGRYNPRPVIRAVNLLQPLGKEKALAAIEDFLRVFPFEMTDHDARDGVFVVLRTLFEVPTGPTVFPYEFKSTGGSMPPIVVGAGTPGPDDEKLLPRFPIAIEGDIPFCLEEGYVPGDIAEPPESHVSYFRKYGKLRAKPLSPTARPVEALLAFEKSPRWYFKRIRSRALNDYDQRERFVLGNQVMRLLDTVYQVTPNCDGKALGFDSDEQNQQILNHASTLVLRWDAKESKYTLLDGASLGPLPRYQFQIGQEFVYSYRDDYVEESRLHRSGPVQRTHGEGHTQWRIWVLEKNADGSVRLLIDRDLREVALDKHVEVFWRLLTDFDIFPDGRIVAKRAAADNGAQGDPNCPTPLFVSLPADKNELAGGWQSPTNVGSAPPHGRPEPPGSRTFRCLIDSQRKGPGAPLEIHCLQRLPGDCVPGLIRTRVCSFDVAAGRLLGFEEELTDDDRNGHSHCAATVKLVSVSQTSGKLLAILKHEADAFFQIQAQYNAVADTFSESQSIEECTDRLAKVRNVLTLAGQSATLDQIQVQYAALLKRFDGDANRALRNAKGREELVRAAPADWELSDFEGRPHHLRDYRGRVVVLDFWYKGCGWCIKAMPQIDELAKAYKSKPVAVLGMNVDEEDEDALSVIRREHIAYATLKARPAEKFYRVSDFGCPFFIVLDQTGRVRHVEIGYSPDLAKRLGKAIDRLASETPTAK
jgi:thiol-disulfide isomerase/thioredoxin